MNALHSLILHEEEPPVQQKTRTDLRACPTAQLIRIIQRADDRLERAECNEDREAEEKLIRECRAVIDERCGAASFHPGALVMYERAALIPVGHALFVVLSGAGRDTSGKPQYAIQALVPQHSYKDGITFIEPMVAKAAELVPLSAYGMMIDSICQMLNSPCVEVKLRRDPLVASAKRWGRYPHPAPSIDDRISIYNETLAEVVAAGFLAMSEAA